MNKSISAARIAEMVQGEIKGEPGRIVTGVAGIREAGESHVSFVGHRRYQHQLSGTKAGIVLISKDLENEPLNDRTFIVCANVDHAFARVLEFFAPPAVVYAPGIHPSAAVDPTAKIGKNVHIGAHVAIEAGAVIGLAAQTRSR